MRTWVYRKPLRPRAPPRLSLRPRNRPICRGEGLLDWLPVRNVRTLTAQIRTPEVRLATWLRKNLFLRPAIDAAQKARAAFRDHVSSQLEDMS